jgi:3-phenylpropionate/trans-cinnamate dioxygenase ferredoxin component
MLATPDNAFSKNFINIYLKTSIINMRLIMNDYMEIGTINDLENGEMKKVQVDGKDFLVVRRDDMYYCADNRCPHMGGDLSQGTLNGTLVTCPRHHSQFDLVDGHVVRWTDFSGAKLRMARLFKSPRPLKTYEVTIDGDKLLARLDESI